MPVQAIVVVVALLNVVCAVLKSERVAYSYLPSSPTVPELPDRRDSGGENTPPFLLPLHLLHLHVIPSVPGATCGHHPDPASPRQEAQHPP